jgi:hypothetical protein
MGGDEKMCGGLILLGNRCGTSPFFREIEWLDVTVWPSMACVWILGSSPRMTTSNVEEGILLGRSAIETVVEDTCRSRHTPSSSGLTRGSSHKL